MTPGRPTLSIVVPAYNESERLAGTLKRMDEHLGRLAERSEILVVDDGSDDDTSALVRRVAPSLRVPVRVLRYARNRGKGHALRVGFAEARGDRIVFMDADLSVPIEFIGPVVALLDQGFDLAIGSRRGPGAEIVEHQPWLRELLGKIFTQLVRRSISNVSDATCGFKGFRAEVGKDLFSRSRLDDWSFDAEILWLARQRGCRIAELPVRWTHREGSKVRAIRAAMESLVGLIRIRWYGLTGAYARSRPVGVETEVWPPGTEGRSEGVQECVPAGRQQHVLRQRAFYEEGEHRHLRPRDADPYAEKLAHRLALGCGMRPDERVLEIGAGFGRFSFSILERCGELVVLDVSARALATLDEARERRGISRARLRTVDCDLYDVDLKHVGEPFDLVIGFFILHHLPELDQALRRIVDLVKPGGRVAFLEPNRRNPLFLAQVACCPDMSWREEKGMFRLSRRLLETACARVGLSDVRVRTFGFFPPQILNRSPLAQRLEERMEVVGWLRSWLPMLLVTARKGEQTG